MTNPLRQILSLGQSLWYDSLSRELLQSGEFQRLIAEDGITGVTFNPSAFEEAFSGQKIYDHDVHILVDQGLDLWGIYEGVVIKDIRHAADLLQPVYEATQGADGYACLGIAPELAYDTGGIIADAWRLFELTGRRNVMISIPCTVEGLAAVEELLAGGMNINVTPVFSVEQYRNTAEAYGRGLTRWITGGGDPRHAASVASVFISRLDTMVDERLQDISDPQLRAEVKELAGNAGVATAKRVYAAYLDAFFGGGFGKLKERGARPQTVLWDDTTAGNAAYQDTWYVDALIGPDTITALSEATLQAYRDHGQPAVRITEKRSEAESIIDRIDRAGVNLDELADRLLEDGVRKHGESLNSILESIGRKRTRLLRGWGHRSASLGSLQDEVHGILEQCRQESLGHRMWAHDPTVWTDDEREWPLIGQSLGWMDAVDTMAQEPSRLTDFVEDVIKDGFTTAVLLGMGGSVLSARVYMDCFGVSEGYLDLKILDSTVPAAIRRMEREIDPEKTLFIVSSKSGRTIEVLAHFKHFWNQTAEKIGARAGQHFVAITDPGTPLGKLASDMGFRRTFLNPADIGGQFSALSYFGLVPGALIGVDLERLLMRAGQAVESAGSDVPPLENPGMWLGVVVAAASEGGKNKLSLIVSPAFSSFGAWLEQLIAESTGKEGKGILPVVGEPAGSPEDYGDDRVFVYLRHDGDDTHDLFVSDMERQGYPVITLRLHGPFDIGREMFRWEFATAVAGSVLRINPFDQPNVKESKELTRHLLELHALDGKLPQGEQVTIDSPGFPDTLKAFLGQAKPGYYCAINAFLEASERNGRLLTAMRLSILNRLKVATTMGFGPRYLHSTGQFHKGGPYEGMVLMITAEDEHDVQIPGERYTFATLKAAQALGDYEALKRRGRKVMRVHLRSESQLGSLHEIIQSL
jgi:transaldolase/glucose-6-phosphate isomerase